MVPAFKNVGERSAAKNYGPVSLLSVVSTIFEKLVNNRIVDQLEKCHLFSDFQYGFKSSQSTADLLTVASDRIAGAFSTWYILDFWQGLACWSSTQTCILWNFSFSVIDDFGWLWIGSLQKNIQLMLKFLKAPFLVLHFSYSWPSWWCYLWYCYLRWWYYSLFYEWSDIWSVATTWIGLETLRTGARSGLLISMLGKLNWFSLTGLMTLVLLIWKWILFLRKNHLLNLLDLLF